MAPADRVSVQECSGELILSDKFPNSRAYAEDAGHGINLFQLRRPHWPSAAQNQSDSSATLLLFSRP
jgi:hypothetical protein